MLLSIIIPVYNVAPYLGRCLDSVRAAIDALAESLHGSESGSEPVAEVICVDDGSTDGSGSVLDEYVSRWRKDDENVHPFYFRVFHQPNAGVSVARNRGLDAATGEWVMFIDSDDTWSPDLLAKLFSEIGKHPDCDAIGFSGRLLGDEVKHWGKVGCYSSAESEGPSVLCSPDAGVRNAMWVVYDKIYRREVLERVVLRFAIGQRIGEDSLFAQQFLAVAGKVILRPEIVGYNYWLRPGSAFQTKDAKLPDNPLAPLMSLYDWWRKYPSPGLRKLLLQQILGALRLGMGDLFAGEVAAMGVAYLIGSRDFNRVLVPYYLRHGFHEPCYKLMWAYFLSPSFFKRKLIQMVRK